jgi:hypothetical protein
MPVESMLEALIALPLHHQRCARAARADRSATLCRYERRDAGNTRRRCVSNRLQLVTTAAIYNTKGCAPVVDVTGN